MRLAQELGIVSAENLFSPVIPATREQLLRAHSGDYVDAVTLVGENPERVALEFGLGSSDNPVFPGMHEASARVAGATLMAANAVWRGDAVHSVNLAGGLHHAQRESASGFCVYNDIAAIRAALDNCDHPALLMVDTIASLGTMPFKMDDWRVDVAVCGSQKGLMTPPGLSFCAAGERAVVAHASANLRTRYWDWTERQGAEHYQKYWGTPPEHMLFALDKALSILLDEGLDEAFERHRLLAGAVQTAVAAWSAGGALEFNVTTPSERAGSVTTIKMCDEWKSKLISDFTRDICGVTLGLGIGGLNGFRIAHMGHINAPMILGALASVELALHTLNYPCPRSGTAEATQFLSRQLQAG